MSKNNDENSFFIAINSSKKEQFEQWCIENNLQMTAVIEDFIDSCLEGKKSLETYFYNQTENDDWKKQVELMIQQALTPLEEKINNLELKLGEKDFEEDTKQELESTTIDQEKNEETHENRNYLTRHQTWNILKKTRYVENNGYESFLRATPQELKVYDICYDENLKRYYLKDETANI